MQNSSADPVEILEGLTVPSLKDLLSVLTGVDARARGSKADLISGILDSARESDVLRVANRLETMLPRRHSWYFTLASSGPRAIDDAKFNELSSAFDGLVKSTTVAPAIDVLLKPCDSIFDKVRGRLYLKLEHRLSSWNWERPSPNASVKDLKKRVLRHVLVIVVRKQEGVIEFRFDGYKQGLATPREERVAYPTLVRSAKKIFESVSRSFLFGLGLQEAATEVTSKDGSVVAIRHVIRPAPGGEVVLDTGEGASAENVTELLQQLFAIPADGAEIRKALQSAPTDSVLLAWKKYDVLTRLAFNDIGTELLYIWRFTDKSEETIDSILRELLRNLPDKKSSQGLTAYVLNAKADTVFRLSELVQRFNMSPEEAMRELEFLVGKGKLNRCYRFRTTKVFHDYVNRWVGLPGELPEQAEDEDGKVYSAFDISSIEFGYRK